jgi:hypothetical protein
MPKDYQFVPKGDVYITSNVRKRTHAAGATLYVVVDKHRKPIGLRCPIFVYREVIAAAQASAASREAAVQSRDAALQREFKAELLSLYPEIPVQDISKILRQALEKRSRRVGRTGTLSLESKVHLAVKAYIRHCHTQYEQLLKDGLAREKARQMVNNRVQEVASAWTGASRTGKDTQGSRTGRRREAQHGQSVRSVKACKAEKTGRQPVTDDEMDEKGEEDVLSISDDDSEDSDWLP